MENWVQKTLPCFCDYTYLNVLELIIIFFASGCFSMQEASLLNITNQACGLFSEAEVDHFGHA
jgi:hypothetical protein